MCNKPKPPPPPAAPVTQLDADLVEAVDVSEGGGKKKRKGGRNALRIDTPSGASSSGLNIPQ